MENYTSDKLEEDLSTNQNESTHNKEDSDEETEDSVAKDNIDLRSFTKKYAPRLRTEFARKLRDIRYTERQNISSQNIEIQKKREGIQQELAESLKKKQEIEEAIVEAEEVLQTQKNSLWGRITNLLRIRNLRKEIGILDDFKIEQEQIEGEITEQENILEELVDISVSSGVLKKAKQELNGFYKNISDIKTKFELEEEIRDIGNISKENGVLFVHMIGNNGYGGKSNKISFGDGFDLITGTNPTLSTSTILDGNMRVFGANTTQYNAGVIIGQGKVLTTEGQLTPDGLFSRSFYNSSKLNFETDVKEKISKVVKKEDAKYDQIGNYNELSVENVEVKAIIVEYTQEIEAPISPNYTDKKSTEGRLAIKNIQEIIERSKETGLPIIIMRDGKLYQNALKGIKYIIIEGEDIMNPVEREISEGDLSSVNLENVLVRVDYDFSSEISVEDVNNLPTPNIPDSDKLKKVYSVIKGRKIDPLSKEGKQLEDIFVSLGGDKEKLSNLSFTKDELDSIISRNDHIPEDIIALLENDFGDLLNMPAGTWEGYSLREHTLMVLRQYQKYHKDNPIPNGELILALHDIGKPLAVKYTSKAEQHKYTLKVIGETLSKLGFSPKEISFSEALVGDDLLGRFLQNQDNTERIANEIIDRAIASNLEPDVFLNHLLTYYMSDASSYTEEAGGKKSLDHLFIFNKEEGKMSLTFEFEQKIQELRNTIKEISREREKFQAVSK